MKILMICDFFHENQQYQENLLIKYYLKHKHEVIVVASTFESVFEYYSGNYNPTSKASVYQIKGFKIIRQPYAINFLNRLRKLKNIKEIILDEAPDLIYIHGMVLNIAEAVLYKRTNPSCKLVFDSHADYSNSAKNWLSLNILHRVIYRSILKIYAKKLDKIFYITPNVGAFLNKVYGIPYKDMSILPLGADTDYISDLKANRSNVRIRNGLGIKSSDFVIFAGGKLTKEKGIDLVIKSFFQLNSQTAHLIIVGDSRDVVYKNYILKLINFHERIHFIGWVDGERVYDYMSACDVAVFPASQSVLWQQAIGVGLPLIIGQSCNQDVTYLNRNNNMLVADKKSLTEEKICAYLKRLMGDDVLLASMKQNAIKTAAEFLSYDKISEETINNG